MVKVSAVGIGWEGVYQDGYSVDGFVRERTA